MAESGSRNYALVPYAVTLAILAVYLRDVGVLGPRARRGSVVGVGGGGGGVDAAMPAAPPPLPGVSISISDGAGGAEAAKVDAGADGGAGGPHSVAYTFCDS